MDEKEGMRHAINEIFKASESLREALDTLDLCGYAEKGAFIEELDAMQKASEGIAQRLQAWQRGESEQPKAKPNKPKGADDLKWRFKA